MKRVSLLIVTMLLLCTPFVHAEDEEKLGVTLDLTYVSKWLSKGVEAYGQKGGLFKSVDFDLYNSGFGVKVIHRNSISAGYVDKERIDFRPYYKNKFFEGQPHQTNYNISVGYEYYPGLSRPKANTTWEWVLALSWPELLESGIVPAYIVHYEYPVSGGDTYAHITGWVHRFLLNYDLDVNQLQSPLHLSAEIAYVDGLGGREHDWAYNTYGISTKFTLAENLYLVPGLYHQISIGDTVSKAKDITYTQVSLKYKF
jgi:hypothetical protein